VKVESYFLLFLSAFGAAIAAIYWWTSYDDGGGIMLVGFALLGLLPGGYYLWWSKRMLPRPEDDPTADHASGAGFIGYFPGASIWPFVFGMGALAVGLALVFGFWTAIFGFFLAISAVIGVIVESRHNGVASGASH
jgi:hypothetical protein